MIIDSQDISVTTSVTILGSLASSRASRAPTFEMLGDVSTWPVEQLQAVILDRDGVINENRADHVKGWDEFQFLPGAAEAVADLHRAGLRVFVFTNQAIINRGVVSRDVIDELNSNMVREIERYGGSIEAVACCPHRPDECCGCRKPEPGLLTEIAERFTLDLSRCLVIGDALSDILAGRSVGSRSILVLTGRGRDQLAGASEELRKDLVVVPDLSTLAEWLLMQRSAASVLDSRSSTL